MIPAAWRWVGVVARAAATRPGKGATPPPPTGLQVVAAQENTLTWEPTSDVRVVTYRIYRSSGADEVFAPIGEAVVGMEAWTDTPPQPGIWWYRVTALTRSKKHAESDPSDPVSSDNVHMVRTLGPGGGTIAPTTGTVSLYVPLGAVAEDTIFTIDQLDAPPPTGTNLIAVSRSFEIGPHGTAFAVPATLTLRYEAPAGYPLPRNYPADTTWVQYWTGAGWTTLRDATVDTLSSTVQVPLSHLSTFGASGATAPHGGYSAQTNFCGYCHRSHQAPGPNLHPYGTERETCYQCHNGGQAADAGVNEIQHVSVAVTTTGTDTFTLSFRGDTTAPIGTPPTAAEIDAALEALPTVNLGTTPSDNVLVTETQAGTGYDVTFKSALGNTDVQQMTGAATSGGVIVTTTVQGRTGLLPGAINDILGAFGETWPVNGTSTRTSLHPVPAASGDGSPQIGCSDCHTPHRDPAEYTRLLRRPDGSGGWLYSPVSGPDIGNQFCYLSCHDGGSSYPAPFGDHTGFEGRAHDTGTVPTADEIQRVAVDATGGTFTLTFQASATTPLAFDVSAADLRTALEALPGIAPGDVDVTGGPGDAGATNPYRVAFQASQGATDVPAMTSDPSQLSGGAGTVAVTTLINGRAAQPSGGIACLNCHDPHGSDSRRLTDANQETLCFSCHTQATPNASGGPNPPWTDGPFPGSNVFEAFNAGTNDYTPGSVRIYHHPVATAEQAGGTRQVECISCHNTHLDDSTDDGSTTSKAVNPTDVFAKWFFEWDFDSGYMSRGSNVNQFCLNCHVSGATTSPISAGPTVPYDVRMVDDGSSHELFDAATWPNSNHAFPDAPDTYRGCAATGRSDAACVVTCTNCHDPHGSSNAYMLRETLVPPDYTTFTVTNADWNSSRQIATLEYTTPSGLPCSSTNATGCTVGFGVQITVTGVTWLGYNGSFTTTNDAVGGRAGPITFDLASDPGGSGPSGGTVAPPSTFTMIGYDGSSAFDTVLRSWCLTCHIERGTDHKSGPCIGCHTHDISGVGAATQL